MILGLALYRVDTRHVFSNDLVNSALLLYTVATLCLIALL